MPELGKQMSAISREARELYNSVGTAAAEQRSKLGSHLKHLNLTFPSVSFYSGIRNDPAFFWSEIAPSKPTAISVGERDAIEAILVAAASGSETRDQRRAAALA